MAITYSKRRDQPGKVANPARGQLGNIFFPCPRSRLIIWSREMDSAVPSSRVSLFISILSPNMVPTYGIPAEFRDGVQLLFIKTVPRRRASPESIGSRNCVPMTFTGVRRHRVSKLQSSSERMLTRQVTMDQLICASLSHTHYWYEVGI